jgi:hypothetical protein
MYDFINLKRDVKLCLEIKTQKINFSGSKQALHPQMYREFKLALQAAGPTSLLTRGAAP